MLFRLALGVALVEQNCFCRLRRLLNRRKPLCKRFHWGEARRIEERPPPTSERCASACAHALRALGGASDAASAQALTPLNAPCTLWPGAGTARQCGCRRTVSLRHAATALRMRPGPNPPAGMHRGAQRVEPKRDSHGFEAICDVGARRGRRARRHCRQAEPSVAGGARLRAGQLVLLRVAARPAAQRRRQNVRAEAP